MDKQPLFNPSPAAIRCEAVDYAESAPHNFLVDSEGYYGEFGGAYIPEILHQCVENLRENYLRDMTQSDNIQAVETLGVDWMGFIFYNRSPRCVVQKPCIMPQRAQRVGVFVNATLEDIALHIKTYGLHYVQLHLRNGMSLRLLFSQLEDIRRDVQIPLILMGYLNPIMQYGFESFCRRCAECGIDGVIIPDLPFRNYETTYKAIADRYDLRVIMLITPETSLERVREIDAHTDGFIYMVSSAAITGAQKDFNEAKQAYFMRIEDLGLRNPRMVGFGISNRQTFDAACAHASGAIIGSRFVSLLNEGNGCADQAIQTLKQAIYAPE